MLVSKSFSRGAVRETDDARRTTVVRQWDRRLVRIEDVGGLHAWDHVAALYHKGICREQRTACFVVRQPLEPNWLVQLGAGAEGACRATEDLTLVADNRDGAHVGVNRAAANLANVDVWRASHPPGCVPEAYHDGQQNAESQDLLQAAHRIPPLSSS